MFKPCLSVKLPLVQHKPLLDDWDDTACWHDARTSLDRSLAHHCARPTPSTPATCRTLMCRATSSSPELLADRELAALIAIDWEVQAVLKQGGLVL